MCFDLTIRSFGTMQGPAERQLFSAQLVKSTLDNMSSNPAGGSASADYDFQTKVLSAAYTGKGALVSDKV